ncbi:MBL fold metallo-hydrolase [Candidatus Poribacteria bacterium]|nr:MBL fold metallo-hydrolase [Candidatus Poribacteria bacterium]
MTHETMKTVYAGLRGTGRWHRVARGVTVAAVVCLGVCLGLGCSPPETEVAELVIQATPVADGIYVLTKSGIGGNIGLCVGDDDAFLVDCGDFFVGNLLMPFADEIARTVASVSDRPIGHVVNTHWHADHAGGNADLAIAGAVVIAHENVRERLAAPAGPEAYNVTMPPSEPEALPILTYTDSMTLYRNGEEIHLIHPPNAHTDGDTIVHFRNANVLHLGDLYYNGMYPFSPLDAASGGSVDGTIAALDRALAIGGDDATYIPGHGPVSGAEGVRAARGMLATVRERAAALMQEGRTREEIVAAGLTDEFDATWASPIMTGDAFVGIVYDSLLSHQQTPETDATERAASDDP